MEERTERAMNEERQDMGFDFPDALRVVKAGEKIRRDSWPAERLYISRNAELDRVDLVREGRDGGGPYIFSEPWLGTGALGGPPVEDCLAGDWWIVEDPRVPTREGAARAEAALLKEIAGEEAGSNGG
jgi:hypothetical protein